MSRTVSSHSRQISRVPSPRNSVGRSFAICLSSTIRLVLPMAKRSSLLRSCWTQNRWREQNKNVQNMIVIPLSILIKSSIKMSVMEPWSDCRSLPISVQTRVLSCMFTERRGRNTVPVPQQYMPTMPPPRWGRHSLRRGRRQPTVSCTCSQT
jgi:hypothetical protein